MRRCGDAEGREERGFPAAPRKGEHNRTKRGKRGAGEKAGRWGEPSPASRKQG